MIDQQLDEVVKASQSLEFALYKPYSQISTSYMEFVNSDNEELRTKLLRDIATQVKDMRAKVGAFLLAHDVPARVIANVNNRTRESIHNQYLNMTQLYLRFIHGPTYEEKIKSLTALWYLLLDMSEIFILANPAPERLLDVSNRGLTEE